jgi:ribose/xylose/arabinose/galactoside ABC-type transport system permease subunit
MSPVADDRPTPRSVLARLGVTLKAVAGHRASGLVWVIIAMVVVATVVNKAFISPFNLINVARQMSLFGIVSIGMTMVILTAGIDLSVGSVVAVAAVVCALMLDAGLPIPLIVVTGLAIGAVLGAVNGAGITLGKIPPFIMTLGMMVIGRGSAMTISGGHPVHFRDAAESFAWLGQGSLLGLPVPVWVFAIVALAAWFILGYTAFGRNVYAVGSNPEAARLSGINVRLTVFLVYVISGFLAGLTALIFISRLTVGEPVVATGLELEAIAITVIGGTSLFGGEGTVLGTILGAAIITLLANMLNLFGVSPFTQQIVKGVIIVAAVLFEMHRRNRNAAK